MTSKVEQVVQRNLEAYNSRDVDAFMHEVSENIALYTLGESSPSLSGTDQIRDFYAELFANSPQLNSTILSRIVIGDTVIDHEHISGRNGSTEAVELVLIYQVSENKINRITVVRE